MSPRSAVVVPTDSIYTLGPGEACIQILKRIPHTVDVTFERPGEAEIVVQGMAESREFDGLQPIDLTRTLQVVE